MDISPGTWYNYKLAAEEKHMYSLAQFAMYIWKRHAISQGIIRLLKKKEWEAWPPLGWHWLPAELPRNPQTQSPAIAWAAVLPEMSPAKFHQLLWRNQILVFDWLATVLNVNFQQREIPEPWHNTVRGFFFYYDKAPTSLFAVLMALPGPLMILPQPTPTNQRPRCKQRGIKLATPQGAGYLTLAAFANCPCKHGRLAHCPQE